MQQRNVHFPESMMNWKGTPSIKICLMNEYGSYAVRRQNFLSAAPKFIVTYKSIRKDSGIIIVAEH